jgi:carbamoyltransferase
VVVLGINGLLHDASVCVMKDGELLVAMEHERVSRFKNAMFLFPYETVLVALKEAGLDLESLDVVAWNFDYRKYHLRGLVDYLRSVTRVNDLFVCLRHYGASAIYKVYQHFFIKSVIGALFLGRHMPRVVFVPHFLAHFQYVYHASEFDECAGLIVDGGGEYDSTILLDHTRTGTRVLGRQGMPGDSLGILYATGTAHLGFRPNADEYKVMGLASYGNGRDDYNGFFDSMVALEPNGRYRINKEHLSFPKDMLFSFTGESLARIGRRDRKIKGDNPPLDQDDKDFAFALQKCLERTVLHVLGHLRKSTGRTDVVLGGGVFLNATMNGSIRRAEVFENVFIPPAPHDAGTAIGAAIHATLEQQIPIDRRSVGNAYLGSGYTDQEIEEVLSACQLPYRKLGSEPELCNDAAQGLCEGQIVGWFQGRMEFGPRALGDRSILADPRSAAMRDRLNLAIKNRESFRPFAPAVLAEHMEEIFEHERDAPYMISIDSIKPRARDRLGAVVHVDGTGRPQSVTRERNGLFYGLIEAFFKKTGVPVVLNTSFNYNDEPIVRTPRDAVRSFFGMGIDRLYVGSYCIEKNELRGRA